MFYDKNAGDKYYCKTLHSAKRKLKELLKDDTYTSKEIKEILEPLKIYMFDLKTCSSPWDIPLLEVKGNLYNLYIELSNEDLF